MKLSVIIACVLVLAIITITFFRRGGYRGAIGFKNTHPLEIDTIHLTGFSEPVECHTLAHGEHSFNYLGRQDLPSEARIVWRLTGDTADQTATVSLATVPPDATDGELFFVLSSGGTWSVEYASQLQLDKLQRTG